MGSLGSEAKRNAREMYAHSENAAGLRHVLVDHLRDTALKAAEFAASFGAEELARLAGLWHDIGKFHPDFQTYLQQPDAHRGPDHSSTGAVFAAESGVEALAFLVAGHHGGLPSREELKDRVARKKADVRIAESVAIAMESVPDLQPDGDMPFPSWLGQQERDANPDRLQRRLEFFLRMLFSALVDADFLDTERHFEGEKAAVRSSTEISIEGLWRRMEAHHESLLREPQTELNQLRNEIYDACVASAEKEPGLFRLTVPTGGGKTLSGMAFALRHALHHGFERVVVAIPYTSIIEQTADIYRKVFEKGVLEHHSAVDSPQEPDPVSFHQQWARLAAENWDAPVVVTTTVQLFESLFANRPSRCRKLHNLTRSVVIVDEVQTLPAERLEPILDALGDLVDRYSVSAVLCTATQPALAEGPYAEFLARAAEIVPSPERFFAALRRVTYETPAVGEAWSWERVAEVVRGANQCLAVVNTKADAFRLLEALRDPEALHLSTSLCGAHRRQVLDSVRTLLEQDRPCRLVSTQVVEAGVDLDFPVVVRAVGPLDRIVQAAGRANREGTLGPGGGRVIVFRPEEGREPPGVYRTGSDVARGLLCREVDLHDPSIYTHYFRSLYQAVDLDRDAIQRLRAALDYPEVAARFRLIPDDGVPVVVPYKPAETEIRKLLELASSRAGSPRWVFRGLQPFVVNLRRRSLDECRRTGLTEEVVEGLFNWLGPYDEVRGLDPSIERKPEDLII